MPSSSPPLDPDPRANSFSSYSRSPLVAYEASTSYPLLPSQSNAPHSMSDSRTPPPSTRYDAAPAAGSYPDMPRPQLHHDANHPRNSSWDVLAGIRKFEHNYSEFDGRDARQERLAFADGDMPNNKFAKLYHYLLNVSIVTRWILFIVPVMAIIWIPGILGFTRFPNGTVWGVKLLWWSIWLTVVWGGWWGSLAFAMVLPRIARATVGVVAVGARKYIDWLHALKRYVALFSWTLAVWVSFQPLITTRKTAATTDDNSVLSLLAKLMFAIFICAAILLGEKVAIQWIAENFHQRSYAERIADQKFAMRVLVTLYRHSSDIPWRSDTLHAGHTEADTRRMSGIKTRKLLKKAIKGVRYAATTTTTALGNVASEIAGSSVLQPNSPQAVVQTALESANKSRMLARRLFYSFVKPGADALVMENVARIFPSLEDAEAAFAIFDKDGNGDATRDELEMACMDFHREQLSIEHSMRDVDSAVGRLDNILMSLYVIVAILIIAVALEAQLATLITSAGTLVLGLSWLIGASLGEVLTSIIFLFVKHPYDVGDRVTINLKDYTVKEIRLLSTVFLDSNSCSVQAPNSILNTYFIQNMRRSPLMSESFTFDVAFSTTFEQIEKLRSVMLAFLQSERRDFLPIFDVTVHDFTEQASMSLSADIKYKSNWQQGALKANRRNKWVCALKEALHDAQIFGPTGNPDATPAPKRYTMVPWKLVEQDDHAKEVKEKQASAMPEPQTTPAEWTFSDKNAVLLEESQDVFGEREELNMPMSRDMSASTFADSNPPSFPSIEQQQQQQQPRGAPPRPTAVTIQMPQEEIEMQAPRQPGAH